MEFKKYKLPHWLNNEEKWFRAVKEINSLPKFDIFTLLVLCDETLEVKDFHALLSDISQDIVNCHGDPNIVDLMESMHELIELLNRWFDSKMQTVDHKVDPDWVKNLTQ